jgi:hypothetical protein
MRLAVAFILTLFLASAWLPAQDRRRDQIQAAHADALASMMDQVRDARIHGDLTVGQFLDRTGTEAQLREALRQHALQIGATRWPNEATCQVQLEVAGRDVAAELTKIAEQDPAKSPLPAEALGKQLADWDGRTFSASGAAMTPEMATEVRPGPEQPLWLSVPEADRKAAVQAAQRDAGRRAVEGLAGVAMSEGKTVNDALQVPAVRKAIQDWVATRPVVDLRFATDGEVLMTVAAPAEDLWAVFRQAVANQNEVPVPRDEAAWQRLHDEVVARLRMPTGRGAISQAPRTNLPPRRALPALPPRWVGETIDAVGSAGANDRFRNVSATAVQLRLARVAEDKANEDLRNRVEALQLGDGRTLGEVARSDPRVAAALDRALRRAHVHGVDYDGDRAARVRVDLDLRYVWQELNRR